MYGETCFSQKMFTNGSNMVLPLWAWVENTIHERETWWLSGKEDILGAGVSERSPCWQSSGIWSGPIAMDFLEKSATVNSASDCQLHLIYWMTYIYIYIYRERERVRDDRFSRSDKMRKNKRKSGETKTLTMDSKMIFHFFFFLISDEVFLKWRRNIICRLLSMFLFIHFTTYFFLIYIYYILDDQLIDFNCCPWLYWCF